MIRRTPPLKPAPPPPAAPARTATGSAVTISNVTDSNLRAPGNSGKGWVRETQLIPSAGKLVRFGRDAPSAGGVAVRSGGIAGGAVRSPVARREDMGNPNAPTTGEQPSRFAESPIVRHTRLSRRLPDVGGHATWQGLRSNPAGDRVGGVPRFPKGLLADMPQPAVGSTVSGSTATSWKGMRSAVASVRRGQKRGVVIRAGLGGLDVAQGPRHVPDSPDGRRGALRDVRAPRLRGAYAQMRTVPSAIVDKLAVARANAVSPTTFDSIESLPVAMPNMEAGAIAAGAPPPEEHPGAVAPSNTLMYVAAAAALLLFMRH